MSDSIFNRPRRQIEPRQPDEHGRDFADQSYTPDQGATAPPHDSFDFLQLPDRDDYAVAPRHALADGDDYDLGARRESSLAPRRQPAYGRQDEEDADDYREDEYGQDADSEYEAEHEDPDGAESGTKRRSTTKVAIAVLGLAVFGSAAAFGYRTFFKAVPSGPTPCIRAHNTHTKVTPVGTGVNARPANGPFADRSGEQLARRDQEPVDAASATRSGRAAAGTAGAPGPPTVPAA